jgi:drug/metabolite transporter (DMT)-like permease
MFPAFLTTIFFSLSAVSGSRCARTFGGLEANFWRLTIATVLLTCYARFFGHPASGGAGMLFMLSGAVGVGLGDLLYFQALPRIGSRLSVLLTQCLSVPFAATVEWLWLGTTLSSKQFIWVGLILGGILIALFPLQHAHSTRREKMTGVCFGVLAAIGNSFGAVLSRKAYAAAKDSGFNIDGPTAAYQRIWGGVIVATVVLVVAKWPVIQSVFKKCKIAFTTEYKSKWRTVWPWVVITSLSGQTFGVTCFQWALKNNPTGVVLPIVATTPLVAIPFSQVLEKERPSFRSILGGLIAVSGVIALLKLK